jgi:ABC-2 type transport system permease protein
VAEAAALLGTYRRLIGARIRAQVQYRLSFALNLLGTALISFLDFAAILILFTQVEALGGWTAPQVAFLYGIATFSFALTDLVIGHLDLLPQMIRQGDFDLILVRPLGSLFQVIASDYSLRRLGKAFQGLVVLVVAVIYLDVDWSVDKVAMTLLTIPTAFAIYSGIWIAFATVAFWLVDSTEVANAFTYGGQTLAQYPVNIFGPWLRRLVVFVVPLAFIAYFPALYVLDKSDPLGLPSTFRFASPLVAALALAGGGLLWKAAVRRYRSTGS